MAFVPLLLQSRNGTLSNELFTKAIEISRVESISNVEPTIFSSYHTNGVTCLAIDQAENKYMLYSSRNGTIGLFDCDKATTTVSEQSEPPSLVESAGHKVTSCVSWYPFDTGMFFSCGYDNQVKVWDTNSFTSVFDFDLQLGSGGQIHTLTMSPCSSSHTLLAVGSQSRDIRLLDVLSGSSSTSLSGHSGPVLSLAWSPSHENILFSGSVDGSIRVWDVRRNGIHAQVAILDPFALPPEFSLIDSSVQGFRKDNVALPGLSSGSVSISHDNGVNGLHFTSPNTLVSTGLDGHVRLWSTFQVPDNFLANRAGSGRDPSIHPSVSQNEVSAYQTRKRFPKIVNQRRRSLFLTSAPSGVKGEANVYIPYGPSKENPLSGSFVGLNTDSGNEVGTQDFKGHFGCVTALAYRKSSHELFSAAEDELIFKWKPSIL